MIQVTGCRILIQPEKLEEYDPVLAAAKKVGLTLPEFSERKEQTKIDKGIVLQIGSKCHEDYVGSLRVGDKIGFAKFGGKYFDDPENPNNQLLVINDEDVICIFKGNK